MIGRYVILEISQTAFSEIARRLRQAGAAELLRDGDIMLDHVALRVERPDIVPVCYGSRPGPQAQAENGCDDCDYKGECHGAL